MQNNSKKIKNKGFALLYSVLIASILFAIGLAIFNITIKELLLSSLGRDSQFAFYAADTGAECALYWDFNNAFATSSASSIECADNIIEGMGGNGYGVPSTFTLYLDADKSPNGSCTTVSIIKYETPAKTVVESRGYNTCDTASLRRIERAIRVIY